VTSMASAGCHRLLREGVAVCVTDADEVIELAGRSGTGVPPAEQAAQASAVRARDELDPGARRVLDALPRRTPAEVGRIAAGAGLSGGETGAALGFLELGGWVVRRGNRWVLSGMSE